MGSVLLVSHESNSKKQICSGWWVFCGAFGVLAADVLILHFFPRVCQLEHGEWTSGVGSENQQELGWNLTGDLPASMSFAPQITELC